MKKIFLLLVFMAIFIDDVCAYHFKVDGIYYQYGSYGVEVTSEVYGAYSGSSYSGEVIIPSTVERDGITYDVTCIGENAFKNCKQLTSVILGKNIKYIREYAFLNCEKLNSITFNGEVIIWDHAFEGCKKLSKVNVSDLAEWCSSTFGGVYSNPLQLTGKLYVNDQLLTSIIIPDGVQTIGDYAFTSLSKITSIEIPNSVNSIGKEAFSHCWRATSLKLGDRITSIGGGAFKSCRSLSSITIPNSVTYIGGSAFSKCDSVKSIVIGDGLEAIYQSFNDITNLTSLKIGDGVKSISDYAFHKCENLETITIGKSVEQIGDKAFTNCTKVKEIILRGKIPPICQSNSLNGISRENCILHVTKDGLKYYTKRDPWREFKNIVGDATGIRQVTSDENVTISTIGNTINIKGTVGGETIRVYDIGGSMLTAIKADSSNTIIKGLQSGNTYIIKIGGNSVKIAL